MATFIIPGMVLIVEGLLLARGHECDSQGEPEQQRAAALFDATTSM